MKPLARIHHAALAALAASVSIANAGILMVGPITDASSQFIQQPTGTYSFTFDSGTVQPNVDPRSDLGSGGGYREQSVLTGWGNGTTGGTMTLITTVVPDGPQDLGSGVQATIVASFTGTGTMEILARDPWENTLDGFGGLGFLVTSGSVSNVTIGIYYDYAIIPRSTAPLTVAGDAFQYGPYASTTGYKKVVGGSQVDFDFSYELFDQNGVSLNPALTNPRFIDNRGDFPFPTLSPAASLAQWNTIRSTGSATAAYGSSFGIHDYGDGDTTNDFVGAIEMSFTPVGGSVFETNAQFNFSIDGDSPPGVPIVVPEASTTMLAVFALAGISLRRRRS